MIACRTQGRIRALLHLLCACALLIVGSVHRVPAHADTAPQAVDLSAYALPDGTVPVLCLTGDSAPAGEKHRHGCEACRLAASADLLAPGDTLYRPADFHLITRPWIADTPSARPATLFRLTQRGPPARGSHA